jgi:hypothetical protein
MILFFVLILYVNFEVENMWFETSLFLEQLYGIKFSFQQNNFEQLLDIWNSRYRLKTETVSKSQGFLV